MFGSRNRRTKSRKECNYAPRLANSWLHDGLVYAYLSVFLYLCISLCDRVADKKAAIGYVYEDSGGGGAGVNSIDDDDASSDEDIDLGQLLVTHSSLSLLTTADIWQHGTAVSHWSLDSQSLVTLLSFHS